MNKYLDPLSRVLLAAIFLASGFGKITAFQAMVAMAGGAGLPWPTLGIAVAALVEIVGGLALLAGRQARWASLALFLFLIPATLVFHAAHLGDPTQGRMQMIEVLKNLAIMGGLLQVYIHSAGEVSGTVTRSAIETGDFLARRAS